MKITRFSFLSAFALLALTALPQAAQAQNLFVANLGNSTISQVTPGGVVSTFACGLTANRALAFNSSGNLFVSNLGNNTISQVTPGGVVSTFASGFDTPYALAFAPTIAAAPEPGTLALLALGGGLVIVKRRRK